MINDCLNVLLNGAKTLIKNKHAQDVLKYLSTVTIAHLANKHGLGRYKYDSSDMKNMVYHYNMNNDNKINKNNIEPMMNILNIDRFVNDLLYKEKSDPRLSNELVNQVVSNLNNMKISEIYEDMRNNNMVQQFDIDTIETSSIADDYEISSGGIYLPDNNVYTSTIEGCNLANYKNDYLTKRIELGNYADMGEVNKLIKDYHEKIDFDKVVKYFNN